MIDIIDLVCIEISLRNVELHFIDENACAEFLGYSILQSLENFVSVKLYNALYKFMHNLGSNNFLLALFAIQISVTSKYSVRTFFHLTFSHQIA